MRELTSETLISIPLLSDLVAKAILLNLPLTKHTKNISFVLAGLNLIGFTLLRIFVHHFGEITTLGAVFCALSIIILILEHSFLSKLFMPFVRTNTEVVIM